MLRFLSYEDGFLKRKFENMKLIQFIIMKKLIIYLKILIHCLL